MAEFIWDDAFFQEYFPKLVKIAANYVYDVALAEDMAQEAFVILLDKWKAGKISSADNIGAWLKVVVINRCRSEMQKMRYHVEQPLKDDVIDPRIQTPCRLQTNCQKDFPKQSVRCSAVFMSIG